jgi:uncharacterized membrane protein (UPF0136 family)
LIYREGIISIEPTDPRRAKFAASLTFSFGLGIAISYYIVGASADDIPLPDLFAGVVVGAFFIWASRRMAENQVRLWLTIAVAMLILIDATNAQFHIPAKYKIPPEEWGVYAVLVGQILLLILFCFVARHAIPISKVRDIRGFEPIMPVADPSPTKDGEPVNDGKA